MIRHPSTAKPTTSTCHQAMRQSGRDSDSEDSNSIYWDQKGLGTGPGVYLHRFGGGFLGPPLASMSQLLLETGSSSDDSSCGSEESKCEGDSEPSSGRRTQTQFSRLDAIDRSVAMARNGQRRRGLGFSRDLPSVAMARNDEFGNEEEVDSDAIDQSVATALAGQSHMSHRGIQVANYSSSPKPTSTANTSSDLCIRL
ncbi:hypothetical protein THAOC_15346 [Thalassiosira oceanica]|uniref:Uncharacterized protein n=1 Tax=Thalassiosira oceanica TaxID=159749 RepID=K0SCV9_THAOC|nr:hypothetical protein THAOC_15346 [Thalassiosira oceanica]|eukprot:EJK63968.1 hypothetical protein THAOC_15346 [Thalassiosira oceanica]